MKRQKASENVADFVRCRIVCRAARQSILRSLLLPLRNPRSLKYLTAALDKRDSGISNARIEREKRFASPDHRGWNRSHTFGKGGFTFCDELRLCLQVLSRY